MRCRLLLAVMALGFSVGVLAQGEGFDDPELDARYRELIRAVGPSIRSDLGKQAANG